MTLKKTKKLKRRAGFTLIELLVVISIISLLSSILLVAVSKTRMKARDRKRMADLSQITKALDLYYSDNGHYPITKCTGAGVTSWDNGNGNYWTFIESVTPPQDTQLCNAVNGPTNGKTWIQAMAKYLGPLHDPKTPDFAYSYFYSANDGKDYLVVSAYAPEDMRNYPDSMRMVSMCGLPLSNDGQCVNAGTAPFGVEGDNPLNGVGFWTPAAANWY